MRVSEGWMRVSEGWVRVSEGWMRVSEGWMVDGAERLGEGRYLVMGNAGPADAVPPVWISS